MKTIRRSPWFGRLFAASLALVASAEFIAAQVVVETAPGAVYLHVPGGLAAPWGSAPGRSLVPMILPNALFARMLTSQMDLIAPAVADAPPAARALVFSAELKGALQSQMHGGVPSAQAVATQNVLVQALTNPQVLAAIQVNLRRVSTPENPALGRAAAVKLAGLAAAAQSERSRAELSRYTGKLEGLLAASIAGDDQAAGRLFDGLLPRSDAAAAVDAPGANEAGSEKIRRPLQKSQSSAAAVADPGRRIFVDERAHDDTFPGNPFQFLTMDARRDPPQPLLTDHEAVLKRFATVAMPERGRLGRYLARAQDIVSGNGGGPVGKGASSTTQIRLIQSEKAELMPKAMSPEEEKKYGPLIEEIHRLLNEPEGPNGFNAFLLDFTLDTYLDLEAHGKITSGPRSIHIQAPRASGSAAAEPSDATSEVVVVRDLPIVSEEDFLAVVGRRIHKYGFDDELPNVTDPAERQRLYGRIFQLLYLANRLSHPELNSFKADMLQPFLDAHVHFKDDFIVDPHGRRSPQNADHVYNLLQLLCQFK